MLSGNAALARGAWEAGVHYATGYPGTPSTEILETLASYPEVDAEWSTNEKVALDVGMGISLAGKRALLVMHADQAECEAVLQDLAIPYKSTG